MTLKEFIATVIYVLSVSTVLIAQVNPNFYYVEGYFRKDGTYVEGHYKTKSNNTNVDNYSTKPNVNPWTGKSGYIDPDYKVNYKSSSINNSKIGLEKYNDALSFFDKGDYLKSLTICKEILFEGKATNRAKKLMGWSYIGLGNYALAEETFELINSNSVKSPLNFSDLFIAYVLNENETQAIQIQKKAATDYLFYQEFDENVKSILRDIHLNYGFPNFNVLGLLLNREDTYIGLSLLKAIHSCRNCEIEMISPKIIDIGTGAEKKRFFLKEDIVGSIIGVEFLLEKSQKNILVDVLLKLEFKNMGILETPILVKTHSLGESKTLSEVYMKGGHGVLISNVNLDGENDRKYFKVAIRQ